MRISGLPDFLVRMRQASKDYQKYRESVNTSDTSLPLEDTSKEQVDMSKVDMKDKLSNNDNDNQKSMRDYEKQQHNDSADDSSRLHLIHNVQQENDTVENENKDDANSATKEEQGSLHYLYLTKLYALLNLWQLDLTK